MITIFRNLHHRLIAVCFGLGMLAATLRGEDALTQEEELAFKQAVQRVAGAVVRIETVGGLDRAGESFVSQGMTTGLVVGADGWIITSSFNFLNQPSSIIVTTADQQVLPARQVATDLHKRLTLLKVEAKNLTVPEPAPEATWRVGQWGIALGRTYAQSEPTYSVGIVSALDRIHGKAMQTDAKISPTNYGGPLIDLQGRVLGVLVPLSPTSADELAGGEWYDSGIGFCIPLVQILPVLPRLKAGETLLPGRAGITLDPNQLDQAVIERVRFESPGYQAGLRAKDRVVAVEGKPVRREAQIRQVLGRKYAGETLRLSYERNNQRRDIEVKLVGELPPYQAPYLGVLPERIDPVRPPGGLLVRDVLPQSPAQTANIRAGDRILAVEGVPLKHGEQLREFLSTQYPGQKLKLKIQRSGTTTEAEVNLGLLEQGVTGQTPLRANSPPAVKPDPNRKTGLRRERDEVENQRYWTYAPESLTPEEQPSLLVWFHPTGSARESEVLEAWKAHCDARRIVLLAPLLDEARDWGAQDLEVVSELVLALRAQWKIPRQQTTLHGEGSGADLVLMIAQKFPNIATGIIPLHPTRVIIPAEQQPLRPITIYLCGSGESDSPSARLALKLKEQHAPLIRKELPASPRSYFAGQLPREIVDWLDSLDRL